MRQLQATAASQGQQGRRRLLAEAGASRQSVKIPVSRYQAHAPYTMELMMGLQGGMSEDNS